MCDRLVDTAETGNDARGQLRAANVERPSEQKSKNGHSDGNQHEDHFRSFASSVARHLVRQFHRGTALENRSEEVFEASTDADPSTDK